MKFFNTIKSGLKTTIHAIGDGINAIASLIPPPLVDIDVNLEIGKIDKVMDNEFSREDAAKLHACLSAHVEKLEECLK